MAQPVCPCDLPPTAAPGCCDSAETAPAAPLAISNPPGLSAIRYRIGTFGSFRRAMLDEVARPDLLGDRPNPFATWHEGAAGDYQTAFVDLWAYLADILTFYQERIANEVYLPTASQRDSLRRLVELIGYRPGPGAAASAQLAFTIEKGKQLSVPAGFRVSSRAGPGKPAAIFETSAAVTALGEHSAIPLSSVAPTNQFAPLSAFGSIWAGILGEATLALDAERLYGSAGASYGKTFFAASEARSEAGGPTTIYSPLPLGEGWGEGPVGSAPSGNPRPSPSPSPIGRGEWEPRRQSINVTPRSSPGAGGIGSRLGSTVGREAASLTSEIFYRPFVSDTTRTIVLAGTSNRLAVGDYVLIVEDEGTSAEKPTLQQISTVTTDKTADTTTITWREAAGSSYQNVTLYAFRVSAGPFGNNAPSWASLPPSLTNSDGNNPKAPYAGEDWDDDTSSWFYLPTPGDSSGAVYLDAVYPAVKGTSDNPGWIVLMTDGSTTSPTVLHVVGARTVSKAAYAVSAKVTRVSFRDGESIPATTYPLRATTILAGSDRLTLQNNLPLPDPVAGDTLILAGLLPRLRAGQSVVLRANLYDPSTIPPSQVPGSESAFLRDPPILDLDNGITTVTLTRPLARQYARAGSVLLANVVDGTHGETVRDEVLGSGDGTAFQSFPLKQKPLTYLPSTDPEGLSAVQSTLLVTVNGVRWNEQATLVQSAPNAPDFTTTLDDAGQTTVIFGDGATGSRLPTGRDNVHASYRKGLGAAGNVAADAIQQLVDSAPGLQKVTNPLPTVGGADPEGPDDIRTNAPASVRTFGRAVSAADYAALALQYPGVAKASAAWVLRDPTTLRSLAQPYLRLTVATADQVPLAQQASFARELRAFLDKRRDPNVALRIGDFVPVFLDVAATIDVDDRYPRRATLNAVLAALNPGINPDGSAGYFAFERLSFGESIHLSAVYAAIQTVAGVADATITTLRAPALDHDPATVRDDIFVRPTELVVVKNDPTDTTNQYGKLTLTLGKGGFVDT